MNRRAPALLLVAVALSASASASTPRRTPKPGAAPLDFTGTWVLDPKVSVNVSPRMENAILQVSQRGNHIFISPAVRKTAIMAEEIVADGQPYEKTLGNGRTGIVRAAWGSDGQSLRLEITAGDSRQRSIWKLSTDRRVWVRDTSTLEHGTRRNSRLVFRRQAAGRTPTAAVE